MLYFSKSWKKADDFFNYFVSDVIWQDIMPNEDPKLSRYLKRKLNLKEAQEEVEHMVKKKFRAWKKWTKLVSTKSAIYGSLNNLIMPNQQLVHRQVILTKIRISM